MANSDFKRYRFSVPDADASVNNWVQQQSNLSMSLRMLIGECIERNGYGDYTCRERIPGARRGRPPKSSYMNTDDEAEQLAHQSAEPVVSVVEEKKPVVAQVEVPTQLSAQPVSAKPGVLSDDDIMNMFK